jgi:hypothetical protein
MACLETFATLRIFSESVSPEEIGRILGILGTKTRPRNPESRYRHQRESHYWAWCSAENLNSTDGLEHVRSVIERVSDKNLQLQQLRALGCELDVCCYWVSDGQGGPMLDVNSLFNLSRLGLEIWWDIYLGEKSEYIDTLVKDVPN